jgi:hypothetical protein
MICKTCDTDMQLIAVNDDPNEGYCYNVWHCFDDGIVAVEHVWNNPGVTWVFSDNSLMID